METILCKCDCSIGRGPVTWHQHLWKAKIQRRPTGRWIAPTGDDIIVVNYHDAQLNRSQWNILEVWEEIRISVDWKRVVREFGRVLTISGPIAKTGRKP